MLPPKPKSYRWPTTIWAVLFISALIAVVGTAFWGDFSNSPQSDLPTPSTGENSAAIKSDSTEMVNVVIAKDNLVTGTVISPEIITTVSFPKELLPSGAIYSTENLLGKVALGPIPALSVISSIQIGSPVAVIGDSSDLRNTPTSDLIASLRGKLVEVQIAAKGANSSPGTPVQLLAQSVRGKEMLSIGEAWTVSSDERGLNVLVSPGAAKQIDALKPNAVWKVIPLR